MATTYITVEEAAAQLRQEVPEDEQDLEQFELDIIDAEQDIDDFGLGSWGAKDSETHRKITPDKITESQVYDLKRAVVAQIKYRRVMGSDFFDRPQRKSGSAEGVSYQGIHPFLSPKALSILSDAGLVHRLGNDGAASRPYDPDWDGSAPGWHNVNFW